MKITNFIQFLSLTYTTLFALIMWLGFLFFFVIFFNRDFWRFGSISSYVGHGSTMEYVGLLVICITYALIAFINTSTYFFELESWDDVELKDFMNWKIIKPYVFFCHKIKERKPKVITNIYFITSYSVHFLMISGLITLATFGNVVETVPATNTNPDHFTDMSQVVGVRSTWYRGIHNLSAFAQFGVPSLFLVLNSLFSWMVILEKLYRAKVRASIINLVWRGVALVLIVTCLVQSILFVTYMISNVWLFSMDPHLTYYENYDLLIPLMQKRITILNAVAFMSEFGIIVVGFLTMAHFPIIYLAWVYYLSPLCGFDNPFDKDDTSFVPLADEEDALPEVVVVEDTPKKSGKKNDQVQEMVESQKS